MPLPVAHALLGASIVSALHHRAGADRNYRAFILGVVFANAADFDFLLVYALNSKVWHRGFTHSLTFGLLTFVIIALLAGKRQLRMALAYGLAFSSHAILDFITTKEGAGVELLWPFSSERLILGWWGLSEMPSKLTAVEILVALAVEFLLFTPLLVGAALLKRKART